MTEEEYDQIILGCYQGKTVAVLGWKNGGRQRANFLRSHGVYVLIGLRTDDDHWQEAVNDGFVVLPVWEAAEQATVAQVW